MEQENKQIEQQEQQQQQISEQPPKQRICKLYLNRKKRFCKFECLDGSDYCHHHAHSNAFILGESSSKQAALQKIQNMETKPIQSLQDQIINSESGRIPCPLDPNHNVDVSKLEKHLKKCQAQKEKNNVENNVWYSKGINNKLNLSEEKQLQVLNEESFKNNSQDTKKFLQQLYNEQSPILKDLIEKIQQNFMKAIKLYKDQACVDEMTEEELYNYLLDITDDADQEKILKKLKIDNQNFSDTQKDHRQVCKMVEVLKQQNLWSVENIYIEFGAGKGLLSHGIAKSFQQPFEQELTCEILMESMKENSANCKMNLKKSNNTNNKNASLNNDEQIQQENVVQEQQISELEEQKQNKTNTDDNEDYKKNNKTQACHVLLELESRRNKMDRLHRDNPYYLRYRTNILDYDVNSLSKVLQPLKYPYINNDLKVIGVSKHMCGGATDLSINTLLNCEKPQKFEGMMIATCCHHRCSTETYTNNDYLLKQLKYTQDDLEILFYCSSWYASGQVKEEILKKIQENEQGKEEENQSNEQNINNESIIKQQKQSYIKEKEWLSAEKKSLIGKMVKRTIDIGRILNLIEKGKQGRIVKYCDFILSPENFVIIAK